MKYSSIIPVVITALSVSSCADLPLPFGGGGKKDSDYQDGYAKGRAQGIKEAIQYADVPQGTPPLERKYTVIQVPARESADGVLIEAHEEYVETVQ